MVRLTSIPLTVLASLSSAWAFQAAAEPRCPSTHTPGTKMVCELHHSDSDWFEPSTTLTRRIALPLNTTIDDKELPMYSVFIDFDYVGAHPVDVRATLSMVDDVDNHAIELGAVASEVRASGGVLRIALDARAQRFAQPAYLKLTLERSGFSPSAIMIRSIDVIQAIGRDR
jgi:hypothetical protein